MRPMEDNRMVSFSLGGMAFEYDDNKNQINIKKHGISFKSAARIFFDYDRIEFYDEDHSYDEDRYNTIGDTSAGRISQKTEGALIGNIDQFIGKVNEILFVVYILSLFYSIFTILSLFLIRLPFQLFSAPFHYC